MKKYSILDIPRIGLFR